MFYDDYSCRATLDVLDHVRTRRNAHQKAPVCQLLTAKTNNHNMRFEVFLKLEAWLVW